MAKAGSGFAHGSDHGSDAKNLNLLLVLLAALGSGFAAFLAHLKRRKRPVNDLGYLGAARAVGELSKLEAGWNSYHAGRITDQSRTLAVELLVALERMNRDFGYRVPAPAVAPTPDGGVELAWHVPAREGELEVEAILLDKGGELHIGFAEADGFLQQARIDDIEAVARQIGQTLQPHLIG